MNDNHISLDGRRVALINPGPPGTCGAVITSELRKSLLEYCKVDHIFIEEKSLCDKSDWGGEPVKNAPFSLKSFRHWQSNRQMPDYDLYHYQSRRNLGLLRYGREPGVLTCHGLAPLKSEDVYTEGTKRRFREQFKYVGKLSMILANSKNTANDLIRLLGISPDKVEVVYFGVNHDIFKPRPKSEIRNQLGIDEDKLVILNVGTERKNKNIERLLEVFNSLARDFDSLVLVRIGDKEDSFTERLEELGIADRVIRPGRIVNPAHWYNAADVYLCMDLHASFGMPNLEAMASGCPVVSSNVEAIPEVVGDTGVFIDPRNVQDTTVKLREVLDSGELRKALIRKGIERAAGFTWKKTAEQTVIIYQQILAKG